MAYEPAVVRRAQARLEEDNRQHQADFEQVRDKAYRDYPRLLAIDRALRRSMAQTMAVCFSKGEDPVQAIAAIKKENLALQAERQWILEGAELDPSALEYQPACAHCGGRGYVGGVMCECLRELCRQEQKKELSPLMGSGRERFENFNLGYYSDRYDPDLGVVPRKLMATVLAACRRYAAQFQGSGNLLFSGATGLGKTFLSACIARQVTDAGFGVRYASAPQLFAAFESAKFGGEGTEPLLEEYCLPELLILDDLGTEMTTQFVTATLYSLLNARLLQKSAMIISTNLRPEDLEKRYGPQISSRLLGNFQLLSFVGSDIRPLLGKTNRHESGMSNY